MFKNSSSKCIFKTFKWISVYCSNAKYILRINDDVVLNTFALISYFKALPYEPSLIYGKIMGGRPRRDPLNGFSISKQEYSLSKYPDYPDGKCDE